MKWFSVFDKRLLISITLLLIINFIGMIGYHLIENMSFFDSFYMTFITISTIGFGEIQTLSKAGRILTVIISVMGIGVIAFIATQTTQAILETFLYKERLVKKRIKKMNKHYIVCGFGRIGRRIVDELKEAGLPVVVIDNNDEIIQKLSDEGFAFVKGSAQKEETLLDAGIESARALICTLSRDEDNVFVTLVARELNPDLFILVRTNHQQNVKKILRAGADKVISPYGIGADRMANVILKPHVDLFLDRLTKDESEDNAFEEVELSVESAFVGKSLATVNVRQTYAVLIVAIVPANQDSKVVFNPSGDYLFHAGDVLIVLGSETQINRLRSEACKDERSLEEKNASIDLYLKRIRKNK